MLCKKDCCAIAAIAFISLQAGFAIGLLLNINYLATSHPVDTSITISDPTVPMSYASELCRSSYVNTDRNVPRGTRVYLHVEGEPLVKIKSNSEIYCAVTANEFTITESDDGRVVQVTEFFTLTKTNNFTKKSISSDIFKTEFNRSLSESK